MIAAIFRVMSLGLWRDRGALLLAFALPSLVFAIFASIFSGAAEGELHLQVGMVIETRDKDLQSFAQGLADRPDMNISLLEVSREILKQRVRRGEFDAGLVIHGAIDAPDQPLFTIITEPSRQIAALSLEGSVRERLNRLMPQLIVQQQAWTTESLVGGLSPPQQARLEAALEKIESEPRENNQSQRDGLLAFESVYPDAATSIRQYSAIAYYAGATSILFLLLSAVSAAITGLEERQSGIQERLLLGPAALAGIEFGRFLFLIMLGFAQVAVIFSVARFGFGLPLQHALAKVSLLGFASAAASAGLALFLVSLCRTVQQATTFSSFFVLVVSAVGGSMVPRFMMPNWLQQVSLFTPNAWAIEGFYGALVRDDNWSELLEPFAVLVGFGTVCFVLATLALRRPVGGEG